MPDTFFPDGLPEILYWARDSKSIVVSHSHPYFQLEIVASGRLYGRDGDGDFVIGPGQCRVFPPGTVHRFTENSDDLDFFSIKFRFPAFAVTNRNDQVTEALVRNITRYLTDGDCAEPGRMRLVAGQLYLLLFELDRDNGQPEFPEPELLRRINSAAQRKGYRLNVNLLADELGLTLSQLKYQFRIRNNTDSPHLKHYLDSLIIAAAKRYLTYSDLRIGVIAQKLQFTDYYTFSRFFKHRTGMSPSEFRRDAEKTF